MAEPAAYTVEQARALLQVSRGSMYALIRTGQVPSIRLGRSIRIPRHRLEQMLNGEADARQNNGGGGLPPAA
jgi:excisionase family DNA binding protein